MRKIWVHRGLIKETDFYVLKKDYQSNYITRTFRNHYLYFNFIVYVIVKRFVFYRIFSTTRLKVNIIRVHWIMIQEKVFNFLKLK